MKKKIGAIIIVLYIICLLIITYTNFHMEDAVPIAVGFIIITFIILFETQNIDAKTMAVLATMSALGGVLRVPFAAIPGVQPVTFISAVTGYTLGPVNGFMVGSMCAFISNFFLGHGPWTLWQMMGWGLAGVFFGVFGKRIKKHGIKCFVIWCTVWGYIYGTILNQWYVVQFMRPITWKVIITGNILSFSYDGLHSLGNLFFSSIFGSSFIKALERYKKRNEVRYIE